MISDSFSFFSSLWSEGRETFIRIAHLETDLGMACVSCEPHAFKRKNEGRRADPEKLYDGFPGQAAAKEQGGGSAVLRERRT